MNPTPFSDEWIEESLDEINAFCNGDNLMTRETLIEILDTYEAQNDYMIGGHFFSLSPRETSGGPTEWADGKEVEFKAEKGVPLQVRDPDSLKMGMPGTVRAYNAVTHPYFPGYGMMMKTARVEAWEDNSTVSITLHLQPSRI